jgi:hypothetical protein
MREMGVPGFFKRMYSPLRFDALFATTGILAVIGIVLSTTRPYPAIAAAAQPLVKGAAIIGAILVAGMIAVVSTRHDQKRADDYLFHILTKSAFIAIFTLFFTLALWQVLLVPILGGVSTHTTIGVLAASWSLAYFYTRTRGTGL